MLVLLTGASCAGKTTAARGMAGIAGLEVHDTDENGVPSGADAQWRQRELERWVRLAIRMDATGTDLVLTGQSPLGELLAVPSAVGLRAAAVCLLDVDDDARRRRIAEREDGRWPPETVEAHIAWGRWHRAHAADPSHRAGAITTDAWPPMCWARWLDWRPGDPRWRVDVIDTSSLSVDRTASRVRRWVTRVRAERPDPFT